MLLACYSHKHISYHIRTITRKAITEFKDCKSLKETQEVIDDLTQNYVQYMERCIEEKTGIKTITYDPYGVLDPVSSLKNISINVLEKHGLLSK